MSVIGKDPQGRIWFKSDHYLTDITDAVDFSLEKFGILKSRWKLVATIVKRPAYFRDNVERRGFVPAITERKVIGEYEKSSQCSYALENVMRLKKIEEIDPLA